MRRAKLWVDDGWHASFSKKSCALGGGWALRSSSALAKYPVEDWPVWCRQHHPDIEQYRAYVKGVLSGCCRTTWGAAIALHSQRLPYYVLEPTLANIPKVLRGLDLPHEVLILVQHWCRLRCGLISLRHLHGRDGSGAIHQNCVFCEAPTAHPVVHCIALCPRWNDFREEFKVVAAPCNADGNQEFARHVLSSYLQRGGLMVAVRWAAAIIVM